SCARESPQNTTPAKISAKSFLIATSPSGKYRLRLASAITSTGRLCRCRMLDGFHDHHLVGPLLIIAVGDSHHHDVLGNPELAFLSNRQDDRMLMIERTNVVLHIVGAEHILRT